MLLSRFLVIPTILALSWSVSLAQERTPASVKPPTANVWHKNSDGTAGIIGLDASTTPKLIASNSSDSAVTEASWNFMQTQGRELARVPSSFAFVFVKTERVGKIWHSDFSAAINLIPVADRKVSLVIGALSGKPMLLQSNLPTTEPHSMEASFNAPEASLKMLGYVESHLAVSTQAFGPTHLIYVTAGESQLLLLSYEQKFIDANSEHLWRIRLDAVSGDVLDVRDMYESIGGGADSALSIVNGTLTALVHSQSSYDSAVSATMPFEKISVNGIPTVTDSLGRWSVQGVSAPYLVSSTFDGPYNFVVRKDGANGMLKISANETPILVEWTNANSDPTERDAFKHINYARNYVRKLDTALTNLDTMLKINVNLNQTCNAFYDPATVSLNFFKAGGQNCSNTGEITDVVFHEFGHRVIDARYTRHGGVNIVDGSLGEGFADIISAFIRDDPRIGIGFFLKGSLLRNCANTKKWPTDLNADIHVSGEIISGAFWDLRKLIGHDTAEHLFHMMGYLNPDGIGSTAPGPMLDAFTSVLTALIVTDDDDNDLANGTPHLAQILKAFALHNIGLSGFLSVDVDQIADQDSLIASYPVRATIGYNSKIGTLDASSAEIHYSIDDGKNYSIAPLTLVAGNIFEGVIPRLPAGSIVEYYATAMTSYSEAGVGTSATASFLVGYRQISLDDAERDRGWSLSAPSDQATTGRWTRDIPYGTYIALPDFVQQDTDHTPLGSYCYLTGNSNKAIQSRDVGVDDVDNGATTLTTPVLDLSAISNPVIKYWYYYRNDAGSNPGLPKWATSISSDGGTHWRIVQNTSQTASGWTAFILPVANYVVPSANTLVRFVASDNVGAIVEAGVDDFEILEGPKSELRAVAESNRSQLALGDVFPNPARSGEVTVPFSIGKSGHVVIVVKDILGRIIATILDQFVKNGDYRTSLSTAGNPPGTYWVQLSSAAGMKFSRLVIAK